MKRIAILAIVALVALTSCASYKYTTVSVPGAASYAAQLQGKTLGIAPVKVSFYNSHILSVEWVKQGNVYLKRHAVEEDDLYPGTKVGYLKLNILKKSGIDPMAYSGRAAELIRAGIAGESDFRAGFFKGLGQGNMGELTSRPMEYDYSKNPPAVIYKDAAGPRTFFSAVKLVPSEAAADTDFVLNVEISVDNEIRELMGVPSNGGRLQSEGHYATQGDYYVTTNTSVYFTLTDRATGKVVASDKTKLEWPTAPGGQIWTWLPLSDPKAYYNLEAFDGLDYHAYAEKAVLSNLDGLFPYLAPFYVDTVTAEKVEKK
jgi:hypothetical protein